MVVNTCSASACQLVASAGELRCNDTARTRPELDREEHTVAISRGPATEQNGSRAHRRGTTPQCPPPTRIPPAPRPRSCPCMRAEDIAGAGADRTRFGHKSVVVRQQQQPRKRWFINADRVSVAGTSPLRAVAVSGCTSLSVACTHSEQSFAHCAGCPSRRISKLSSRELWCCCPGVGQAS